jgi:hypothetical protein
MNKIDEMTEREAKNLLNDICNEFSIGGKVRTPSVILRNIKNSANDEFCKNKLEVFEADTYNEEDGPCLFFSFSRDDNGKILGEPPETEFLNGYMGDDFDPKKWTHFIKGIDFNFVFTAAGFK